MKNTICRNCGRNLTINMCQEGGFLNGEFYTFCVGCSDAYFNEEIEVYRIEYDGSSFLESTIDGVANFLKDIDLETPYNISKKKIKRFVLLTAKEFKGF